MSMHNINDLRERLFNALDKIEDGTMDLDYAKAMVGISQTIINATKLEVDYVKNVAGLGTGFIPVAEAELKTLRSKFNSEPAEIRATELEPKQLNK